MKIQELIVKSFYLIIRVCILESEIKRFFNHGLSPPTFANHKKCGFLLVHKQGKDSRVKMQNRKQKQHAEASKEVRQQQHKTSKAAATQNK